MMNNPVLRVDYNGKELLYAIANEHTAWRVKSLNTKEPDTVAWICGMSPGETFVDIGANMGIYTILAAKHGLKVHAFEPEAENYALLCRSVMFNDDVDIVAYPVALSDHSGPSVLYLSGHLPGGSCHSVGENLDHRLTQRKHELRQGCWVAKLDDFNIKADHIKIDVDGFEHKVIDGAEETLKGCKSVLLEINQNLPEHRQLTEYMKGLGFEVDPAQVEAARRKEGTFQNCGNWILFR